MDAAKTLTPATEAPDESTHFTCSVLSWATAGKAKISKEKAKTNSNIDVQQFFFMAFSIFRI